MQDGQSPVVSVKQRNQLIAHNSDVVIPILYKSEMTPSIEYTLNMALKFGTKVLPINILEESLEYCECTGVDKFKRAMVSLKKIDNQVKAYHKIYLRSNKLIYTIGTKLHKRCLCGKVFEHDFIIPTVRNELLLEMSKVQ
jgi:hypothetical protein